MGPIQPIGVARVDVHYGEQPAGLSLTSHEERIGFVGRQGLQAIRLDWSRIFALNANARSEPLTCLAQSDRLHVLLDKYQNLFKSKLGMISEEWHN